MPDIYFNCAACNNKLVVDSTGAGLTLACPICNVAIIIPVNSTHKSTLAPTTRECPFCKNQIPATALICVLCGHNLKTGDRPS